ncbi:MAG: hypothetical protein ABIM89_10250, partial [Mycobacteriales bacterium]
MEQPRGGGGGRDQQSVRGLLIMVFVPVVIILGMLATAVLGNGGRDVQAPLPGISSPAVTQPRAPPAEPASPTTPLPVPDATVPAGQVAPSPLPQP